MTEVALVLKSDLKTVSKKHGWLFNWRAELALADREVYKLTIIHNSNIVQGMASLTPKEDHVFINLIENAPFNRGQDKVYEGVAGNLVAFACRLSFQRGYEGFVAFHSKTELVEHYVSSLNAKHYGKQLMIIDSSAAKALVDKYFKL